MNRIIAVVLGLLALVAGAVASTEGSAALYALGHPTEYNTAWAGVGLFLSGLFLIIAIHLFTATVDFWRG